MMPEFEYDETKNQLNLRKHGIDFVTAQDLWNDSDLLEFASSSEVEERYLIIGKIASRHWSAILTYRGRKIRLISVRRARKEEIKLYERE